MSAFTIILPHKRNPGNNAALSICLDMLQANTVNDFVLLMDAAVNESLYPRINAMVEQATTDYVVYWCSDIFPAPAWDVPMLELVNDHTFVTNILVEPGAIGVHHMNVTRDFGRKPDQFQRANFEAWVAGQPMREGEGWYAPYMVPRAGYLQYGGLDTTLGDFPYTTPDIDLFERWKAAGNIVRRAHSFAYHLQRFSDIEEQEAAKRL